MSKAKKGKLKSEETKAKMSFHQKNRKKIECPYCRRMIDITVVKRWHFENCKFKDV